MDRLRTSPQPFLSQKKGAQKKGIEWQGVLSLLLATQVTFVSSAVIAQPEIIQKCQDLNGNWYYGSGINRACDSTISILNQNGLIIRQQSPFRAVSLQQQQQMQRQRATDRLILRRYSSIESIKLERARKLSELNRQQQINSELIDKMDRDAQQLINQDSPAASSALQERRSAVTIYRNKRKRLNTQIQSLDISYERITSSYLEALSRKGTQ